MQVGSNDAHWILFAVSVPVGTMWVHHCVNK